MVSDYITEAEAAELIDALPYEYKAIVATAAETGFRIGDLCRARWSDIDFAEQTLTLSEDKTDKVRTVAVSPKLLGVLTRQRNRQSIFETYCYPTVQQPCKPVSRSTVWRWIKRTWGLLHPESERQISPHSLRKLYAVRQRLAGKSLYDIKCDLNHERDDVTIKYAFADMLGTQEPRYTTT